MSGLDSVEAVSATSHQLGVGQRLVGVNGLFDPVESVSSREAVVAGRAAERVVAVKSGERDRTVVERRGVEQVVAAAPTQLRLLDPVDLVVSGTGQQRVGEHLVDIGLLLDLVDAIGADQTVVSGSPDQRVIAGGAVESDGAGAEVLGVDRVVAAAAGQPGELDSGNHVVAVAGQL